MKNGSPFRGEPAEKEIGVERGRGEDESDQLINFVDHKVIVWRCGAGRRPDGRRRVGTRHGYRGKHAAIRYPVRIPNPFKLVELPDERIMAGEIGSAVSLLVCSPEARQVVAEFLQSLARELPA